MKSSVSETVIWMTAFQFAGGTAESLVWRRYAPAIADVHALGMTLQAKKQEAKPTWRYTGSITACVGTLRGLRTSRGHGFNIYHAPDEGVHHAEIIRVVAPNLKLSTADKAELRDMLESAFGPLEPAGEQCQTEGG